jgi:predicted ArsR family transcriptional regulator
MNQPASNLQRRQFLKNCAGGLCICAAVCTITPALSLAAETKVPEDWRLPFIKRRYAKLLEILVSQTDEKTADAILEQLGRHCASENKLTQQHVGDVDGFIREFKQRANEDITYDREKNVITVVGPERGDCYCPLIDRSKTSSRACNCSLGWQQYTYETLLGKKVQVALKESVLRGGKRCVFEIRVLESPPNRAMPS